MFLDQTSLTQSQRNRTKENMLILKEKSQEH